MVQIAVIGECMIEINGAPFSQTLSQNYGGDTLNTAIYLARLLPEANIHYVTALGSDAISRAMTHAWQQEGINTDAVLIHAHLSPGLYWILLDSQGERSFAYWRHNSAASQWLKHPDADKTLARLLDVDWVYLSGISLAILDHTDRALLFTWLTRYRAQGGKIAFDSNYRPTLWHDRDEMLHAYNTMYSLTDLALLTREDEEALWTISAEALNKHLIALKIPTIILKQGAKSAYILKGDHTELIPSIPIASVIDSTAAGDSFNAGVIAGICQQNTLQEACHLGHQLASTVIQHKGAIIPITAMP